MDPKSVARLARDFKFTEFFSNLRGDSGSGSDAPASPSLASTPG